MKQMLTMMVAASAWIVPFSSGEAAPYTPQVGQRHVDFTLPDIQTGKAVSLMDFRGKKVLLIQFASW